MKAIKIESSNGKTIITTETPRLFLKPKIRRFVATRQITDSFWNWLELPENKLVPDMLSFQLSEWKQAGI